MRGTNTGKQWKWRNNKNKAVKLATSADITWLFLTNILFTQNVQGYIIDRYFVKS